MTVQTILIKSIFNWDGYTDFEEALRTVQDSQTQSDVLDATSRTTTHPILFPSYRDTLLLSKDQEQDALATNRNMSNGSSGREPLHCPQRTAECELDIRPSCTGVKAKNMAEVRRHLQRSPHSLFVELCLTCNVNFLDRDTFDKYHGDGGQFCNTFESQSRGVRQLEQWRLLCNQLKELINPLQQPEWIFQVLPSEIIDPGPYPMPSAPVPNRFFAFAEENARAQPSPFHVTIPPSPKESHKMHLATILSRPETNCNSIHFASSSLDPTSAMSQTSGEYDPADSTWTPRTPPDIYSHFESLKNFEIAPPRVFTSSLQSHIHAGFPLPHASVSSSTIFKPYRCMVPGCDREFTGRYGKGNLARHSRQKHKSIAVTYVCEDKHCDKVFLRKDARLKHYRLRHSHLVSGHA